MRTLALVLAAVVALPACDPKSPASAQETKKSSELRKKLENAYASAGDWLVSQQDKSGAWLQGPPDQKSPSVSYTAIIVTALARAPKDLRTKYATSIDAGAVFIASKKNDDGSFGEGPSGGFMKTYATAVALMALAAVDREKYADPIRGAQAYLKQNQLKEGIDRGGSGYGDDEPTKDGMKKTIANLSTTGFAADAMEASGLPKDDEFWKLCVEFVRKCQNNSETNADKDFVAKLQAQGLSVGDDGGLYYTPSGDRKLHKAGTVKVVDKEVIQSYGSMTYHGIKTYLFAGLKKDSPEVKAAIDWIRKNYTVDAHPGFPFDNVKRNHLRGLFYYYYVMARAMDAIGEKTFKTFDGKEHEWAAEMGEQLLRLMKDNKMWVNENPAWWENDPLLVTSYVLNTLDLLLKNLE